MRDLTDVDEAVASLTAALDEEYPGEWLDPTALCAVLDELERLRGIEHAVRTLHRQVVDSSWPTPGHCEECWVRDGLDYVPWPCPTIRALGEVTRLRAVERRAWDVADAGGYREDWEAHVLRDPRPGSSPGETEAPEGPSSQVSA